MRIISGVSRGIKLKTLPGGDVTRPTTDRVKEALFSAVQFKIEASTVLDLFAGTGQLGIEALSRGAAHCVFVDENKDASAIIKDNLKSAALADRASVACAGVEGYLFAAKQKFDLIFLDPPYKIDMIAKILPLLDNVLNDGGTIMAEAEKGANLPETSGNLVLKKVYKYGSTCLAKYEKPFV